MDRVTALFALDSTSARRVVAKTFVGDADTPEFELRLMRHFIDHPTDGVTVIDDKTVFFEWVGSVMFFLLVDEKFNEFTASQLLACWGDVTQQLCSPGDSRLTGYKLMENLTTALLIIDEMFDGGYVLCIDPDEVIQRVSAAMDAKSDHTMRQLSNIMPYLSRASLQS